MKYVSFSEDEKRELFDKIAAHFYESNFGTMSKSDFELMMFDFYIKKMMADSMDEDGTINFSNCSDYKISKDLGITQQRVRNLKIKNELVNPMKDFEWKQAFAKLISNARFENHKAIINIPDPNLFIEIQNYIEDQGAFIDKQLNSKLLVIREEYFIDLLLSVEPEKKKREIVKSIKKIYKEQAKIPTNSFNEKSIGKSLVDGAMSFSTVLTNISSLISPTNVFAETITKLFGIDK